MVRVLDNGSIHKHIVLNHVQPVASADDVAACTPASTCSDDTLTAADMGTEASCTSAQEEVAEAAEGAKGVNEDAIDEDLMCSVCCRPDDEANMLVCDCKKGYHIYCLTPKLDKVPTGAWFCPQCRES